MHRIARAIVPALTLTTALTTSVVGGAQAADRSDRGPAPGFSGSRITLDAHGQFSGYDALTTKDGTTYVGWIASMNDTTTLRQIHLCVLPRGATACQGGVQDGNALGESSAQGLQVLNVGGTVQLVWIYQGAASGDFSGTFGVAQVNSGILGSSSGVSGAPTYGTLTSAFAKGGAVSVAVVGSGANFDRAYYYPTLSSSPESRRAPFPIGNAQIAADGGKTVMTVSDYGTIGEPVRYAVRDSGGWSGFAKVKHTWTVGNIERLITTKRGIRLITATGNASYQPVVSKFKGSKFRKPKHTGDRNACSPASHDVAVDASGRMADVTNECGKLAISNLANTTKAGITRVPQGGTPAGGPPQISTSPSGRGWVVWGIESSGAGNVLYARPIRLPALARKAGDHGAAGSMSLVGPASCMPVSTMKVRVKAKPARGWSVVSKKVKLNKKALGGKLNGASLKPSHSYTLRGVATLRNGGRHATLKASIGFRTCGRP